MESLVPQLEGRGVRLHHVRFDPSGDLAELVASEGEGEGADLPDVVLVHGFESVPRARAQAFLRRSNFTRARLAKTSRAVLLVVGSDTWAWLMMELPDLVRWADGPFVLPAVQSPPHPLVGLPSLRAHLGVPIPPLLDQPLHHERGVDPMANALAALEQGRLVVLGGPPGVGVSHLATKIEHEARARGWTTTWPPNVTRVNGLPMVGDHAMIPNADVPFPKMFSPGQPFGRWLDYHRADIVIVPKVFADEGIAKLSKQRRSGVILSSTSAALAPESGFVMPVYVPPVRVESGAETELSVHEPGVSVLEEALDARARMLHRTLASALTKEALRFLILASGGVPSLLWHLATETSRRGALDGVLPASEQTARVVALDMAFTWLEKFRSVGSRSPTPNMRRRSLRRREEDEGLRQVLIIDGMLERIRHPLVRLASGPSLSGDR